MISPMAYMYFWAALAFLTGLIYPWLCADDLTGFERAVLRILFFLAMVVVSGVDALRARA
jgi:hypothetical protein